MYEYSAKIVKVVDGDTVDAHVDLGFDVGVNIRFRLYGINAPEIHSKDPAEKTAGLATMNRLIALAEGKLVSIKTHRDAKEKFGRYLAELYPWLDPKAVPDKSINQILVDEGLAKPYFGGKR